MKPEYNKGQARRNRLKLKEKIRAPTRPQQDSIYSRMRILRDSYKPMVTQMILVKVGGSQEKSKTNKQAKKQIN